MAKARALADVSDPEADSELDPDAAALARLESVGPGATDGDAWVPSDEPAEAVEVDPEVAASSIVDPPKKSRARSRRKPPANIGEPSVSLPVVIRNVSFGKSVANVTATLTVEVEGEHVDIHDYMGAVAWMATIRGDYLGAGLVVRDFGSKTDAENNVKDGFKLLVTRFDQGVDQLERYIQPLLPDDVDLTGLFGLSTAWRLNVTVEVHGVLTLHEMQGSFDLTAVAPASEGDLTREPIA